MYVTYLKPARSRVKPPGPNAEIRRLCVTSDNGLFWSINCESCEEPKNSFTAAEIGFGLIKSCGVIASKSPKDKRSLTALSTRINQYGIGFPPSHLATNTTVTQVVDIIYFAATITDVDQFTHYRE